MVTYHFSLVTRGSGHTVVATDSRKVIRFPAMLTWHTICRVTFATRTERNAFFYECVLGAATDDQVLDVFLSCLCHCFKFL